MLKYHLQNADVAESADALDSGSSGSNALWVQVPSSASNIKVASRRLFYLVFYLNEGETLMVSPSNSSFLPVSISFPVRDLNQTGRRLRNKKSFGIAGEFFAFVDKRKNGDIMGVKKYSVVAESTSIKKPLIL